MIRWSSILMSLVVFTASIPTRAQSATPATPPSAENTQILKNTESFIRELFAWGPDFKLKIGPLSPSPSQYFYTVPIEVTVNGQTDKGTVFISKDGKTFLRGEMFNTAANPYADNHRETPHRRESIRRPNRRQSHRRHLQRLPMPPLPRAYPTPSPR